MLIDNDDLLPLNLGLSGGCRQFPLSPSEGERVGLRGPTWGSGPQSASKCRGILSLALSSKGGEGTGNVRDLQARKALGQHAQTPAINRA